MPAAITPDPNVAPPVFDPAAFKAEMMAGINSTLNGFAASMKKDFSKLLEKPEVVVDPNAPNPEAPPAIESKTIADLNLRLQQHEKAQKAIQDQLEASKKETEQAKAQAAEEKRQASFQSAIADIPFQSPKARQQFTDAYLGKVKYAEDGSLIVETDKGPVSHDVFLQTEAENSPYLLAPEGHSGAGASAGRKSGMGPKVNVLNMSTEQIMKMSPADRSTALAEAINSAANGG